MIKVKREIRSDQGSIELALDLPGKTENAPPTADTARTVIPQKAYNGNASPVLMTVSTKVGSTRYTGMEQSVRKVKVFLRPNKSETAAQPNRPPRLPPDKAITYLEAKAEVTMSGRLEEKKRAHNQGAVTLEPKFCQRLRVWMR